jgi:hypothetical protein
MMSVHLRFVQVLFVVDKVQLVHQLVDGHV